MVDLDGLRDLLNQHRQNNKDDHDEIKALLMSQNGRIGKLERWRSALGGAWVVLLAGIGWLFRR